MRKWIAFLLALGLMLSAAACGEEAEEPAGNCALYYLASPDQSKGGDAVAVEYCDLPLPEDPVQAAEMLLERYWEGPAGENLTSPLPIGLQLLGVEERNGRLEINVSSHYRTLSGVELTLADSCLTLTLTQLARVYSVVILVSGKPLEYRTEQEFQRRDILLSSSEDLVGTVQAMLWFVDQSTGTLVEEKRKIPVYEGKTRAESVMDALMEVPETEGLTSPIPEGYEFHSVRVEEDVCYVNLSSQSLPILAGEEQLMLQAAAQSLCSLPTVSAVRYLVDGEIAEWYGTASVQELYTEK